MAWDYGVQQSICAQQQSEAILLRAISLGQSDECSGNAEESSDLVTVDVSSVPKLEGVRKPPCLFKSPPRNGRRFKGVRHRKWGRFVCEIRDAIGKRIWLGSYDCEEEAARVYDMAARILQGEGAWLNFPHEEPGPVTLPRATVSQLLKHRAHTAPSSASPRRRSPEPAVKPASAQQPQEVEQAKSAFATPVQAAAVKVEGKSNPAAQPSLQKTPSFGWKCFLDDIVNLTDGELMSDAHVAPMGFCQPLKMEELALAPETELDSWSPSSCLWVHDDLGTIDMVMA